MIAAGFLSPPGPWALVLSNPWFVHCSVRKLLSSSVYSTYQQGPQSRWILADDLRGMHLLGLIWLYLFFFSFLLSLCFPQRPFCCFVTRAPHPERKQLSYFLSCVTAGNTHLSVSPTVTSLVLVVALLYPRAEPQHLSTYRILCDNFLVDSTQQQQGRSSTKHRYARQIRGLTRAAYPSPILLPTV